jgi:hypothetical protein
MTDATPVPTTAPAPAPAPRQPLDPAQQSAILNAEVAKYASKGWIVSSVAGTQAVLQRKKRIGWFWNILLTLLTGVWIFVVIYKLVNRKTETLILTVDAYGRVSRS